MKKPQPKIAAQIRRMFALAKGPAEHAWMPVKEYLENLAGKRLSMLSFDEANTIIAKLGGDPVSRKFVPRRTRNYHNQQAGIKTIATAAHLQKLDDLWQMFPHRTDSGLTAICQRTIKRDRPRTADECNKIVEAVKSMNKRERESTPAPQQPKFRRVA